MAEQHFAEAHDGNPPANYERFFVPAIGAPLAADLIRVATLRPGERVLDVACGTGVVARLASQQIGATGAVAGLDVNPGMLAVARSAAPPGISIEWHEASAEAMPLPDASFDVVLCQMGLQFMPDKHAALREMQRVLVPGMRRSTQRGSVGGKQCSVFCALLRSEVSVSGGHFRSCECSRKQLTAEAFSVCPASAS